jgi:hypothetical protein
MRKVRAIHIHAPSETMGNAQTIVAGKKYEILEGAHGVEVESKITKRIIVVPYGNLKNYELEQDAVFSDEPKKGPGRPKST